MRVAVTGASGFVGRHVLAELRKRPLEIVAVTRTPERLDRSAGELEVVRMDLAERIEDPHRLLGSPDVLMHLAWGGLPNYRDAFHLERELPAQRRFLEDCVLGGLGRLAVSGTCFEYGLRPGELDEGMPADPVTAYGQAKDRLRAHLERLRENRPFELAWMRLFYLYGEGQYPRSLYPLLMAAIDRGERTFDMSPGDQSRDYLPMTEAARLMVDLALRPGHVGVVNVCSGDPVRVADLAQRWLDERRAGIALNLGRLDYAKDEPLHFWGSRRRLDTLLAVAPGHAGARPPVS